MQLDWAWLSLATEILIHTGIIFWYSCYSWYSCYFGVNAWYNELFSQKLTDCYDMIKDCKIPLFTVLHHKYVWIISVIKSMYYLYLKGDIPLICLIGQHIVSGVSVLRQVLLGIYINNWMSQKYLLTNLKSAKSFVFYQ